jgi:LysM repeat protein
MQYTVKPGDSLSRIASAHGVSLAMLLAANARFKDHPDRIRPGDVIEIPAGAAPAPPAASATPASAAATAHVLGKLSEKFETSGRGCGTVSTGKGDAGGASYGSYQMTSRGGGTVGRFVSQPDCRWRDEFVGLTPGTAAFTAKWKAIAAAEPEAFQAAQHAYVKATHFDVLVENVRDKDGLDLTTRSHALQDVLWSTAVQHGPHTPVVHLALAALRADGVLGPDAPDFDRALIKAIYAERGRRDAAGQLVYFSKNSAAVQDGVAKRFVREEADALAMLEGV